MCGIAGIYSYHTSAKRVERDELLKIRDAMRSRGPNGEGLWISDEMRVGLAHRRLSIIDLSDAGSQPMMFGDYCIVFNGEIYNYLELKSTLEGKGHIFKSRSDTEVLLHLYAEYGSDMLNYLRGMYAFAIWDKKRNGLFLARDPFGIKPLYYADDGKTIRFASQVKALLHGGGIDTTPEPAGHAGFFLWGHVPEPYTFYKAIRSLPAGQSLWIGNEGRHRFDTFFNIQKEYADSKDNNKDSIGKEELIEELHAALNDSIQHHLIADVPVGIFLSSGLDSTTIAALASENSTSKLQSITLAFAEFAGGNEDESILAKLVADKYGIDHQTKWIAKHDFNGLLADFLQAMDQPTIDGLNSYLVSKVAAQSGLKVALSGMGGDEIFGGYPSFKDIPMMVRLLGFGQFLPGFGKMFRWISAPVIKKFTSPKYAGLLEYGGDFGGAYLLRHGLYMPWELPELMDPDMARDGWNELCTLPRLRDTTNGISSDHMKVSALELSWYMRNQLLRDVDWASMAHSLEIRVPLLDIKLIQSIIPLMQMGTAPSKIDMARTPNVQLPDEILNKPKTGFNIPLQDWLSNEKLQIAPEKRMRYWSKKIYSEFYAG